MFGNSTLIKTVLLLYTKQSTFNLMHSKISMYIIILGVLDN